MRFPAELKRTLLVAALLFYNIFFCLSQTYQFKNFNTDEGLANRFVYTINQDSRGFIWLGTGSGLSLFDGFDFHNISLPDSSVKGFPVSSLDASDGSVIYGFSDGKVFKSNGNNLDRIEGIDAFRVNCILEGDNSEVFILTQSKGVFRYNMDDGTTVKLASNIDHIIYSGALLSDNRMLLGTQVGLFVVSVEEDRISPLFEFEDLHFLKIQALAGIPGTNDFIAGTEDDGVYRVAIDGDMPGIGRLLEDELFKRIRVQNLLFDSGGNLWISTFGDGIIKLDLDSGDDLRIQYFNRDKGLTGNDVRDTYQDREGNIWIGHYGDGVSILASDAYTFVSPGTEGRSNNVIAFLEKDGNYMTYHCVEQQILARETIRESMEKLPNTFIQTHKSYIVNIGKVVSYDKNILNMGKDKIPVSDSYREKVFKALES